MYEYGLGKIMSGAQKALTGDSSDAERATHAAETSEFERMDRKFPCFRCICRFLGVRAVTCQRRWCLLCSENDLTKTIPVHHRSVVSPILRYQ